MDDADDMGGLDGLASPDLATPEQRRQAMLLAIRRRAAPASTQGADSPDLIFSMGNNPLTQPMAHAAQQSASLQAMSGYRDAMEQLKALGYERGKPVKLADGSSVLVNPLTGETTQLSGPVAPQPKFVTAGDRESGYFDPSTRTFTALTKAPPPKPVAPRGGAGGKTPAATYYGEDFEPIHPDAPPPLKDQETRALRDRYAANRGLQGLLDEYEKVLASAGPTDRLAGPIAQRLLTLQGAIKPKWVESNGFKRFTENENQLMDLILPKSSGAGGIFRLPPSVKAAIEQIRSNSRDDIQQNLAARGLRLKTAPSAGPSAGGAINMDTPATGTPATQGPHGDRVRQRGVWFRWNGRAYEPEVVANAGT